MGEAYITRRGGSLLNFKVVDGTSAPKHKENTIWVNTDTKMTGWLFSPTQPPNPEVDGMVWFLTGISSNGEFNALKKNGIQVCPISAKQFISANGYLSPRKSAGTMNG